MTAKMWRKGTLVYCWWDCKLVQSCWKQVWRFLNKLKIKLQYDPGISFLSIYQSKRCRCAQLCPTLCNFTDCSLPGSPAHGIFQARIIEWAAISFSRGDFWSRDRTPISCVSCIGRQTLYHWATREGPSPSKWKY